MAEPGTPELTAGVISVTPLVLSDRLISLAEQADRAGMRRVAERILSLACCVLDEEPLSCRGSV
ncbi:MAG: hypothetical protein JO122_09770 [Acetobacteraceae bacterium]|nr:hypothetical protein [Acetobacteraceae bacterium]